MQIYNYTQKGYDLYDKKFLQSNIDRIYKYINCKDSPPCFLVTKYLDIQPTEDLKMIKLIYRFGRPFRKSIHETGISNESFSFRIYVNKHGSGSVRRFSKSYFKPPKIISRYQLIPLGRLRVRYFKGYDKQNGEDV